MSEQLTFDLPVRISLERGDFFVSDANALAVARLEGTSTWTSGKIALVGPQGAGKTHLAHVWAEAEGGALVDVGVLEAAEVVQITTPMAVEVPDHPSAEAEHVLFHLHNHLAASGLPLLLIARTPPARWPLTLPDLKSRMDATEVVHINAPDDALLAAVLVKLFSDRQLRVPPSLIAWLTKRMDRSFAEAQRLVTEVDAAALAEGGGVTRKLAQRILDNAPGSAP
ncbi:MAG: chromosomal replication initiator DnaA [Silicimonas sp.]|nr:chromosomal replication initiator DnaA [Silicimonas sp.]